MSELLKRKVSLPVLKVRLLDDDASSTPSARTDGPENQTLTPKQRIFCELQVTGNATDRGLVTPTSASDTANTTRRRGRPRRYEAADSAQPELLSRTLAQWSYAPAEMQVPVHYQTAAQFRDRPSALANWFAESARKFFSTILSEMRADRLERFAAMTSWLPSGKPTLPTPMIRELRTLLRQVMREGDSLWLELAEPTGYLPLLPWEAMLRPVTEAPILRLSPHPLKAFSSERQITVALCLTVPSARWTPTADELSAMVIAIRDALPEASTVHVFADDLCESVAKTAIERVSETDRLQRRVKGYALPNADWLAEQGDDAWRAWVVHSLGRQAVDILHCYAPGMLFPDQARLVITRAPTGSKCEDMNEGQARPLRYVTPADISEALVVLGAWAIVLSAPTQGPWAAQSRLGLRLFTDELARLRAGVTAFHDGELDTGFSALRDTYRFMIGDPSIKASTATEVAVYCHPARATAISSDLPSALPAELMVQYRNITETIQSRFGGGPVPAWVAAAQRIAEQAVSRIASDEASDEACANGVAAALSHVQRIIAQSADGSVQASTTSQTATGGSASA